MIGCRYSDHKLNAPYTGDLSLCAHSHFNWANIRGHSPSPLRSPRKRIHAKKKKKIHDVIAFTVIYQFIMLKSRTHSCQWKTDTARPFFFFIRHSIKLSVNLVLFRKVATKMGFVVCDTAGHFHTMPSIRRLICVAKPVAGRSASIKLISFLTNCLAQRHGMIKSTSIH